MVTVFLTPRISLRCVDGLSLMLPDRFEEQSSLMMCADAVLNDDFILAEAILLSCSKEQLHFPIQEMHGRVSLRRRTGQADKVTRSEPG